MYIVEQSGDKTGTDIVRRVMDIESKVFKPEYRGDFDNIVQRMKKYPEMLILAKWSNEIIGYMCYFPISKELHTKIINNGQYFDDNIEPKDVKLFEERNNIFIISAAIYPEHQNKGVADMLMQYMNQVLLSAESKGNIIEDIITIVISDDGEKFVKRFGFELCKETEEAYKIYRKVRCLNETD